MKRTKAQLKDAYQKECVLCHKAMKDKCIECLCDQKMDCEMPDCALYHWQPFRKRKALKRA